MSSGKWHPGSGPNMFNESEHIYASSTHAIIGSDNGLSPVRHQVIIWTNYVSFSFWPLGTNISQIVFEIQKFSFKKMHLKMSSGEWRPCCLDLNVLTRLVSSWPLMELLTSFKFLCIRLWREAEIVITANGPTVGITGDENINTLRSGQNGRYFEDDVLKFICLNEKYYILFPFILHFYQGSNYIHSALGQIKAWHRTGDKPLSKPMMAQYTNAYMNHSGTTNTHTNSGDWRCDLDRDFETQNILNSPMWVTQRWLWKSKLQECPGKWICCVPLIEMKCLSWWPGQVVKYWYWIP